MSVTTAKHSWKSACADYGVADAAGHAVGAEVEPADSQREGNRSKDFLRTVEPVVEKLAALYRSEPAHQGTAARQLLAIAKEWPSGAPLNSALIRALGKTLIIDTPLGPGGGPAKLRGRVLEAWRRLRGFLDAYGVRGSSQVLVRAGVAPRLLHARVRDAAWFERDFALAGKQNQLVMHAGPYGVVDEMTASAWRNHCAILEAQELWHAVVAHVEAVRPLCQRTGQLEVLDDLERSAHEARGRLASRTAAADNGSRQTLPARSQSRADKKHTEAETKWRESVDVRLQGLEAQAAERRYLTTKQAAGSLGYAVGSFRRVYGQDERLRACASKVGGQLVWDRKCLKEYLDAKRL